MRATRGRSPKARSVRRSVSLGENLFRQAKIAKFCFFSSGRAAAAGIPGGVGRNLMKITTEGGHAMTVNAEAAPHFKVRTQAATSLDCRYS
jgi:hypothetical protein